MSSDHLDVTCILLGKLVESCTLKKKNESPKSDDLALMFLTAYKASALSTYRYVSECQTIK